MEHYRNELRRFQNKRCYTIAAIVLGILAIAGVVSLILVKCRNCGNDCECGDDDFYDEEDSEEFTDEHGCRVVKDSDLMK